MLSRFLLFVLLIYLIWKLIRPYIQRLINAHTEVKGKSKPPKMNIKKTDIEDAEFKEIDDSKSS